MKILVAEDDEISRHALASMLSKWGYDVVAAADGATAWRILQGDDAPRLAILDWMMPGMDGAQVCRRIRARTNGPYIYVIMLTARGAAGDVLQCAVAGANDYIKKPTTPRDLQLHLRMARRMLDLQEVLTSEGKAPPGGLKGVPEPEASPGGL